MYIEIGAFDAKSKLSQLLREIRRGQCYTITVRGVPVADLIPSEGVGHRDIHAAVEAMRNIHKVSGVSPENIAEWINEGRQ